MPLAFFYHYDIRILSRQRKCRRAQFLPTTYRPPIESSIKQIYRFMNRLHANTRLISAIFSAWLGARRADFDELRLRRECKKPALWPHARDDSQLHHQRHRHNIDFHAIEKL